LIAPVLLCTVEEEGRYEVDSWQLVPEVWKDLEELGIAFEEGNRNLDNDAYLVEVDEDWQSKVLYEKVSVVD